MRAFIFNLLFPKAVSLKQFHAKVTDLAKKYGYTYVCCSCEILRHEGNPQQIVFTASITQLHTCHGSHNKLSIKECLEELEQKAGNKFVEPKIKEVII